MRKLISLLVLTQLSLTTFAFADHNSFLPGEPNPNKGPLTDNPDQTLLDNRKVCDAGLKLYQVMECLDKKAAKPNCQHFEPVLKCQKKSERLKCSNNKVLRPKYRCVPTGQTDRS